MPNEETTIFNKWMDQLFVSLERFNEKIDTLIEVVHNLKEAMVSEKANLAALHQTVETINVSLSVLKEELQTVKADVSTIKLKLAWGGVPLIMLIGGIIAYLLKLLFE